MMCQVGEEGWKVKTVVVVVLQDHEREVSHSSLWRNLNQFWPDTMDRESVTKLYLKYKQWRKITPELTFWFFTIFSDFTFFKYE